MGRIYGSLVVTICTPTYSSIDSPSSALCHTIGEYYLKFLVLCLARYSKIFISLHRKIIVNKNIYKMTSQFSPKVSQILAFSREEAARLASRSVGPEHLLLGILRDKTGPVHELFL